MTNDDLKIITTLLRGELSISEQQAFLNRMETDPALNEAFLLEKAQFESLGDRQWSSASKIDPEFEQFYRAANSDAVKELHKMLSQRQGQSGKVIPLYKRPYFKWVAAVVLIALVSASLLLSGQKDTQTLYAQYMDMDDVPTLITRGTDETIYSQLEQQFRTADYEGFLANLETQDSLPANATLLLYEGLAHIALNNNDQAIITFDELIASPLIDAPRGYWFKALALIKSEEIDRAKAVLKQIVENNGYKAEQAKDLLKKLP